MVSLVFLLGVGVWLAAFWERRIMPVAAFLHFRYLLAMPEVELLDAGFEAEGFGVVLVSAVFAL